MPQSKSAKIRAYLEKHGDAPPKEVLDSLKLTGKVSTGLVSQIKSGMRKDGWPNGQPAVARDAMKLPAPIEFAGLDKFARLAHVMSEFNTTAEFTAAIAALEAMQIRRGKDS